MAFRESGAVPVYFEAAGVVVTLILVGQVLELRVRARETLRVLLQAGPFVPRQIEPLPPGVGYVQQRG